jgi:hypothetical protein
MRNGKPLVIDGYCGLGGWTTAFLEEGWQCIGIDIERHDYGDGGYPGELILQDMRTVNGAQFKDADLLVFSPPCTEYSYMAMPWKRGKQIASAIEGNGEFPKGYKGSRTVSELNDLFNQCFRIQREVCEAAGHHVPMVVENVRGAQRWVGKARWNFGSFYLWGDVPALMPIPSKRILKYGMICAAELRDKTGSPRVALRDDFKTTGMNWSDPELRGKNVGNVPGRQRGVSFTDLAGHAAAGVKGFTPNGEPMGKNTLAIHGSKSNARKEASAMIAKIPEPLARWIAKCYLHD